MHTASPMKARKIEHQHLSKLGHSHIDINFSMYMTKDLSFLCWNICVVFPAESFLYHSVDMAYVSITITMLQPGLHFLPFAWTKWNQWSDKLEKLILQLFFIFRLKKSEPWKIFLNRHLVTSSEVQKAIIRHLIITFEGKTKKSNAVARINKPIVLWSS